jgi:hypothetical protein
MQTKKVNSPPKEEEEEKDEDRTRAMHATDG